MTRKSTGAFDQEQMRLANLSVVLRALADKGRASRSNLAELTGLTKPAVSGLISTLESLGLTREIGAVSTASSGRPPSLLEIDASLYASVFVEINASFMSMVVRDLGLNVLSRETRQLNGEGHPRAVLDEVKTWIQYAVDSLTQRGRSVVGVVLAVPALVEHDSRTIVAAPALNWGRVEVEGLAAFGWGTFTLENLANLAALGESRLASYRSWRQLVHLEVGTGIGTGTVHDGVVQRGSRGFAGAIGHTQVDPNGRICGCGRQGCLEAMAGARALFERTVPDLLTADRERAGLDLVLLEEVRARALGGDEAAVAGIEETGAWIGRGASVLINMLNPDVLTIGGFVPQLEQWILSAILGQVDALVVAPNRAGCVVQVPQRGADAPEFGAAILARDVVFAPNGIGALLAARTAHSPAGVEAVSLNLRS